MEDPVLADAAAALNASGAWGFCVDARWHLVSMSDELRLSNGGLREMAPVPPGFWLSAASVDVMLSWRSAIWSLETWRVTARELTTWMAADLGGIDAVRAAVDPRLADAVVEAEGEVPAHALSFVMPAAYSAGGKTADVINTAIRVRHPDGRPAGAVVMPKPAVGMAVSGALTAGGDLGHFRRMLRLAGVQRRPAAILFADLESSSALSRRLSTASYFALGRRLVRAADRCVVDAGGVVGRHAGDGVVAFFLVEDSGSESAAAAACVASMRALREQLGAVAVAGGLEPGDLVLRFGLHWGATLHIGHVTSVARAEVNALGDEVNEAARIEACATGGRSLASKALIERLDPDDAATVGVDPARVSYTALSELASATEKARRDVPNLAVCEV